MGDSIFLFRSSYDRILLRRNHFRQARPLLGRRALHYCRTIGRSDTTSSGLLPYVVGYPRHGLRGIRLFDGLLKNKLLVFGWIQLPRCLLVNLMHYSFLWLLVIGFRSRFSRKDST